MAPNDESGSASHIAASSSTGLAPTTTTTTTTQLPTANISRLMKQSLPPTLKLSSDTKLLMQSATQEFIALITSEAQERADGQKRSTLNGDDVLYALGVLGFDEYERLGRVWLSRYRVAQGAATQSKAGK